MGVARRQNPRLRATANAARARGLPGAIRRGARRTTIRSDARADMSDDRRRIAAARARRVGRRDGGRLTEIGSRATHQNEVRGSAEIKVFTYLYNSGCS